MSNTRSWTVRVNWLDHEGGPNDNELERILSELAGRHAAINLEPDDEHGFVRMCATVTLEAASLRQAVAAALADVEAATRSRAYGLEVLPTHEFDRMLNRPSIPELVGYAEIAQMAGVSRQRAAQLPEIPGFPPAVVQVRAGPLRVRRQVAAWLSGWERKNGRPNKTKD
jgi:hypothetical protein